MEFCFNITNGKGYLEGYYDNEKLIFKTEFSNGKYNGKGKIKNYEIEIEGEYLNGELWNAKIYNNFTDQHFEVMNGNGYIRIYTYILEGYLNYKDLIKFWSSDMDIDMDIEFEGEYLNEKRNGKRNEY